MLFFSIAQIAAFVNREKARKIPACLYRGRSPAAGVLTPAPPADNENSYPPGTPPLGAFAFPRYRDTPSVAVSPLMFHSRTDSPAAPGLITTASTADLISSAPASMMADSRGDAE